MRIKIVLFSLIHFVAAFMLNNKGVFAEQTIFYKEINLIGGYASRDHWVGKSSELFNSIGFEYYRKFSNEYGDFLTADLQVRLAYDSTEAWLDAWGLEIHNAWLQYKVNSVNKLKIGHFDSPFGLEQVLDTHATLLQTLAPKNIGFKKDWGVVLEGALPNFDYSTALQIGSGMSIYRKDGSFLATGRIGTPAGRNLQGGVSLMYGKTLQIMGMSTIPRGELLSDQAVLKKRVGLDGQYLFGPYLFKSEIAYGKDEDKDVLGHLYEIDYTVPRLQNLELQLQFQSWRHDLDTKGNDDSTLSVGAAYKLNSRVTLRLAFMHDLNLMEGDEDDKVLLQFYYFGF
jgi:hypothetical protein